MASVGSQTFLLITMLRYGQNTDRGKARSTNFEEGLKV